MNLFMGILKSLSWNVWDMYKSVRFLPERFLSISLENIFSDLFRESFIDAKSALYT